MPPLDENASEGMLIAATLAGDQRAFSCLVSRFQPALFRVAMSRVARRELAEEVVQETLLCAHRWLATYDSRFSFRTWLWTILLNQCTRQAKREAKHSVGWAVSSTAPYGPSLKLPIDRLLEQERSEQVHALLARLPEAQADALRLRFFGGLTFPEIAAAMGCSEPGAKNRVKTGLLKLAQWLNSAAHHPTALSQQNRGELL